MATEIRDPREAPRDGTAIRSCSSCGHDGATADGAIAGWPMARCPRCGARFTVDVPTDAELAAIYDRLYGEGEHAYRRHLEEVRRLLDDGTVTAAGHYRRRVFLDRHRPRPGDRLLEVGCGVGTFLLAARRRGWTVEGIDLSDSAVRAGRDAHGLPVRAGSFLELAFEPHAYRAIVAWEVLEHLPRPQAFLARARDLLAPGGVLAISVPNEGQRVPHPPMRGPASLPPVHLSFWDRSSLRRALELNGFRVERLLTQRTMLALSHPRHHPLRFARLQAAALAGRHEGIHLFAAAVPEG